MNRVLPAILLAPLAASCAHVPAEAEVESIRFETEVCFGRCPIFAFEVQPDGTGTWDGKDFVAEKGAKGFTVAPDRFDAFRQRLAPFRPAQSVTYGPDRCDGPLVTDNPSVVITWTGEDGTETTLDWYLGCRQPGLAEHQDAIYEAWKELPAIVDFLGEGE
jgi:hypothetical protein